MAKERAPAFQFFPKDFLTDTKVELMSNTEVGIYIRLICYCWLEGALPLETASLAKMARMQLKQFTKLWEHSVVRTCFHVGEDGLLHHKRLDSERNKQDTFRRRQSDAAASRWHSRTNATAVPAAVPPQCSPSPISDLRSASPVSNTVPPAPIEDDVGNRAAKLLENYPAWYAQHRRGARVLIKPALDFQRACDLCRTWDDDRLEKIAVILLTTDDEWVSGTDRGFGVFASRAAWCDDRLKQWEVANGVAV